MNGDHPVEKRYGDYLTSQLIHVILIVVSTVGMAFITLCCMVSIFGGKIMIRIGKGNDCDKIFQQETERFEEVDGTMCCKACGVGGVEIVNYCYNCGAKFVDKLGG